MAGNNEYPLRTIYFYLTPECNLACRHCWIAPRYSNVTTASEYLPLSLFRSVIQQALPLGLTGIKLTGGEPLLHPDFEDILSMAREYNLDVTVETNGTLITPELARSLARCKNVAISVSLDGVNADTHEWVRCVNGSYDAALRGIRALVKAGIRPQVIMTLFKRNLDQVEPLIQMSEAMGAGSIKFNIIQSIARGSHVYDNGEAPGIREILKSGDWVHTELGPRYKINLDYSIPPAFKPMGTLFGQEGSGCAQCGIKGIIGVLADGSFALCGIGQLLPEMVFGHVDTDSLKEIWRSNPIVQDIRINLPNGLKGVCRQCVMRNVCLGSCLAQNFSNTRDLWTPYWLCQEAYELGLFPKARLIDGRL